MQSLSRAQATQSHLERIRVGDVRATGDDTILDDQRRGVVIRTPAARVDRSFEMKNRESGDIGKLDAEESASPGVSDARERQPLGV
jgi:hypothetical protein